MRMEPDAARAALHAVPRVTLATVRADAVPQLVPITFAPLGSDVLTFAVDHKPKSTQRLARLANIAANPAVCLLADAWSDDWSQLWWARADGRAVELDEADPRRSEALDALCARYAQYREFRPAGPVVWIDVLAWSGWRASG